MDNPKNENEENGYAAFFLIILSPFIVLITFLPGILGAVAGDMGVDVKWGVYLGWFITGCIIYSFLIAH